MLAPIAAHAQETTGTIRGTVVQADGTPVANATVTVVHEPSGSRNTVTSDASGSFNAAGLRLGGPYTVTVAAPGFDVVTNQVASLIAGTPQRLDIVVGDIGAEATGEVTVVGSRVRNAASLGSGPATVLSARDIAGIASVDRDIRNLAVRDPLVSLEPNGGLSIAGQNNRFNRFTVDGIAFGDPFGLEAGGLVSARGPVPLDAIGEFSVEAAPVDIQQGFFQGGAINTQLLSGSNRFTAMGAGYYSADSLRGSRTRGTERTGAFESQVYTAQITGPIIRDRLFFAVTYERLRDTVPADITPNQLGITDALVSRIQGISDSVYGFDALGVPTDISEADDKLVAKIDWNIADGHRLALTYIYNEGNILAGQTGAGQINANNPILSLQSNTYNQGAINHFGVAQLNDQWTDSFSTQLRVSYADYTRLQVPFGDRSFGQFQVCLDEVSAGPPLVCSTGNAATGQLAGRRIQFGPDISRQANELFAQSLSIESQATLQIENHTLKMVAERRRQDISNLFAQRVSGAWYFDSITDLQNRRANELDFATPLRGGIDSVTAEFQNNSWTFGIQDTWEILPSLIFTYGIRYDLFDTPDRPAFNQSFLDRSGFTNISTLNGRDLWQPRFGLNWNPTPRLSTRASAGVFGGGNPNVWISNNYSNPGPTLGRIQVRRQPNGTFQIAGVGGLTPADVQRLGALTLNNVSGGTGIPAELINRIQGQGAAGAPTNALDPDFRIPSQWRFTGSADYRAALGPLGDDWNLGADVIYSKVRNALTWTDLRVLPNGVLPDGRPRYAGLDASVNTDILLTNTDRGDSWNVVGRIGKRWQNGFFLNASYTYQSVTDVNPGTSSVAQSNYNGAEAADPNMAAFGISNFQRDHQYRLNVGYDAPLFGDNITRVELFFNSRSTPRFSYVFADQASGSLRSGVFGTTGTNNRYLLYVPDVSSSTADPRVTYASEAYFQQFRDFVLGSPLAGFQGQIAPKNIGRNPRFDKLDLSIRQDVPLPFGTRLQVFMDLENVLNLLNSDWGSLRQTGSFGTVTNVTCAQAAPTPPATAPAVTPATPCQQYLYSPNNNNFVTIGPVPAIQLQSSLWSMRLGARIRF